MNTSDLYKLMWNDERTSSYVMAIIPSEALSYVTPDRKECCYIVNTRKTENKDSPHVISTGHWVAIVARHGVAVEVFDSLAQERICNSDIETFIKLHGHYNVNSSHISSKHCGYYCLVYAYYRSRGHEPDCIVQCLHGSPDIKMHCLKLFRALNDEWLNTFSSLY